MSGRYVVTGSVVIEAASEDEASESVETALGFADGAVFDSTNIDKVTEAED